MARTSSKTKIVKSIPNSETGRGVLCTTASGEKYTISQNPLKIQFTLWKHVEDGFEKIATANNPLDFDDIMFK